jgi:hypothetical protein
MPLTLGDMVPLYPQFLHKMAFKTASIMFGIVSHEQSLKKWLHVISKKATCLHDQHVM